MTRRRYSQPVVLPARGRLSFPDPRDFDREGLLAVGGDLSAERLLLAYRSGIFPWPVEGMPLLWFSPDPRFVLDLRMGRIPRSNTQQRIEQFMSSFQEQGHAG